MSDDSPRHFPADRDAAMAALMVGHRDLLPPGEPPALWVFWPDEARAWRHAVTFAGRARRLPALNYGDADGPVAVEYPLCVGRAGACPPAGARGPAEYAAYQAAVADPSHPRHAHYRTYHRPYGDVFEPAGATAWMYKTTPHLAGNF